MLHSHQFSCPPHTLYPDRLDVHVFVVGCVLPGLACWRHRSLLLVVAGSEAAQRFYVLVAAVVGVVLVRLLRDDVYI